MIKLLADEHLGRVAKYLRMLGFDTAYEKSSNDRSIILIAKREGRIVLTRDLELFRRLGANAFYVHEKEPRKQLLEVIKRLGLCGQINPLSRCLECNTPLVSIKKGQIRDVLPPKVEVFCDRFWVCPNCGRLYWNGTHYERMRSFVDEVIREV